MPTSPFFMRSIQSLLPKYCIFAILLCPPSIQSEALSRVKASVKLFNSEQYESGPKYEINAYPINIAIEFHQFVCYKPLWDLLKISLAWPHLMPSLNRTLFLVPTSSHQSFMPHQNHYDALLFLLKTFWKSRTADTINSRVVKPLLRGFHHMPHCFSFHEFSICIFHPISS